MSGDSMEARRLSLIAEVNSAFEDVTRDGGVSWSQSEAEDIYRTAEEYAAAAKMDTDVRWQDLVEDEAWRHDPGVGGFAFLDAIGFRYYLPAAMVRDLKRGITDVLDLHLNCPPPGAKDRKRFLKKWSLLDERQRRCVAEFIRYGIDREAIDSMGEVMQNYQHAWENYWHEFAAQSR